ALLTALHTLVLHHKHSINTPHYFIMPNPPPNISKLNATNYNTWADEMEPYLHSQNAWQPVSSLREFT
ncbi:hypothetical protein C0991_010553, partial [Blastosporella zonata]